MIEKEVVVLVYTRFFPDVIAGLISFLILIPGFRGCHIIVCFLGCPLSSTVRFQMRNFSMNFYYLPEPVK